VQAFYLTDDKAAPESVLQQYSRRWSIEINQHECMDTDKQLAPR